MASAASSNVSSEPSKQTGKARGGASSESGVDGDTLEQPPSDLQDVQNPPAAMSQLPKLSSPLSNVSTPGSTATSAAPSREPSPVRHPLRLSASTSASRVSSRRRKGSQGQSPSRTSNNTSTGAVPSANSVQQAFAQAKPQLPVPVIDASSNVPSPDKSDMASRNSPQHESARPNTSLKRSPPPEESETSTKTDMADEHNRAVPRGGTRGASGAGSVLETVQEASLPSTPSTDKKLSPTKPEEQLPGNGKQAVESGSESGGNRSSDTKQKKRPRDSSITSKTGDIPPKRSFTSLNGARGKPGDGSVRNMIVETETVSSVPQVSLGVGAGERGASGRADQGTIRMKPSTETIRPKKERKRQSRKPTALQSGTVSSKADIFEAKVASAVDEADVSDSDETFVYESNPPDPYPVVQHRYHSRTPSTTSMVSQMDQFAGRSRTGLRDGGHSVTGKRSMKFTNNNAYNSSIDGDAADDIGRGSSRAESNGHTSRHIGRHGRSGYASLFDRESPFPPSQPIPKSPRHLTGNAFRHSRHASPRTAQNYRTMGSPRKTGDAYSYDIDGEGADDERTPLVGSVRINRSRHGRRPNSASLRQLEYVEQRRRRYFSRYGSCILFTLLILLLVGGATTFVIAVTKPLRDLSVIEIQNVLASEQEIMLDLDVLAVNPNLFPIAVNDMDVNIFAKSRFVGSEKFWRDHGPHPDDFPRVERSKRRALMARTVNYTRRADLEGASLLRPGHGIDRGTDPIPDPSGDPQTMLLGRVFEFDSPLTFDPSPWEQLPSESIGQIRLRRPGNKTEEGGTERWERVLQHPFELIVRGVVKYQLPLSSRMHLTTISSSVKVIPDGDTSGGDGDIPRNDTVKINGMRRYNFHTVHLPVNDGRPTESSALQARTTRAFSA
ncbi:hypothetical protein DTO271D3_468 [Paecilomyces variotii]|nr:hypothetical protein DTO271D3_468 [Paecilomyces variotii]